MKPSSLLGWVLGVICGAFLLVVVVGFLGHEIESGRARECDALGRTMLGKQAYTCERTKGGSQ